MEPTANVLRTQKAEGADLIMEKGYVTERDEPMMMDAAWCHELLAQINDELRLRTLKERAVLNLFNYYMGPGSIIYDPQRLTADQAKATLQKALGFTK
ncbi:MAG: hypothetical protein LKJ29_06255 [Lactobacillus sp.]|jgi:hypothetical protein|uniref:Uncharacterized protein n=1 Tax=Lacticaseibacillus suilingensis TaxID=2799577 RepID=A0ABW4BDU5_9LACO|nr:hypothetical protein [Lacticaseibacillus suilingensis]MCI1893856.1 hypothetical protein [Lactobacillus sp.]MCI1917651.1 hypothetical protein [Lactobacillus sp.]MCI1941637.1 hypothetical protein [Lactobacillus sp.]MCI1972183.1 hypothetical protein [Lactobacillus sp.]MCI2017122.1 hypothetical protein [Lactobacillus sp.]